MPGIEVLRQTDKKGITTVRAMIPNVPAEVGTHRIEGLGTLTVDLLRQQVGPVRLSTLILVARMPGVLQGRLAIPIADSGDGQGVRVNQTGDRAAVRYLVSVYGFKPDLLEQHQLELLSASQQLSLTGTAGII